MSLTELRIDGRVATPDDGDWDQVRQAWNLSADPHPRAVAFVESPEDVAATVRFARGQRPSRLRPGDRPRRGRARPARRHDSRSRPERMRGIEIDATARTARVEAGVLVTRAERGGATRTGSAHCRDPRRTSVSPVTRWAAASAGSDAATGSPATGSGRSSWSTAAGEAKTVDADHDADLFWALRGGGGAYAIVTALHLDLVPIADAYAGALVFPAELGVDAIRAYRDWTETVSDDITSVDPLPPPAGRSRRAGADARPGAADDRCRLHRRS